MSLLCDAPILLLLSSLLPLLSPPLSACCPSIQRLLSLLGCLLCLPSDSEATVYHDPCNCPPTHQDHPRKRSANRLGDTKHLVQMQVRYNSCILTSGKSLQLWV